MPVTASFGKRYAPQERPFARSPIPAADELKPPALAEAIAAAWPVLTIALCLLLTAIFYAEHLYGVHPSRSFALSVPSLVALGGADRYLVVDRHEWWRLLTAPLLHANFAHIAGNLVVLAIAGRRLESLVGRAWLAAAFALGAIAGSIGSLSLNDAHTVSVGASGAIMCLVAFLFTLSFHAEAADNANRIRRFALFLLIPALLPYATDGGGQVDIGAHFGGVVMGTVLGFFVLALWPETGERPPLRSAAGAAAALVLAVAAAAALEMTSAYPAYALRAANMAPPGEIPVSAGQTSAAAPDLVRKYPHDPMVRLLRAIAFLEQHDATDAEEQIRAGLAEKDALAVEYPSELQQHLETVLAMTLAAEGKRESARVAAAPICALATSDSFIQKARSFLKEHGACG
jgi:rhomboid protease GluP